MHRRKTGALIERQRRCSARWRPASARAPSSRRCGASAPRSASPSRSRTTSSTSTGDPALLGKAAGADAALGKPTYPSTAGLAAARRRARELRDAAIAALAPLGARAGALAQLADFVVSRAS